MAKTSVRVRDRGYNRIKSRLAQLKRKPIEMTVGVHSDAGSYPNGTEVLTVAVIQEFHRQPFIRPVFDADKAESQAMLRRVAESAVRAGQDPMQKLQAYGKTLVGRMQARAPVRTGLLRSKIDARVKR